MALAANGISVVGVDKSAPMLERARERLAKKPKRISERIELVTGDFREVELGRRFPLVISPFNAFQHLYTREDVERALAVCKRHLEPDGRLAFDVLMPDPVSLARDPDRFYRCRPMRHPRDRRRYGYQEAFRYDHDTQVQTTVMLFTDPDDPSRSFVDQLPQRQFFPRELEALLHYNGFEVLAIDGGFLDEPIDLLTESMVVVARARVD
jgi:SAM-dependent methyltransferase